MSLSRKLENERTSFYVQTKWSENSFQIIIIEGLDAWQANVTDEKLKALADERQKNRDEYYIDVKDSISNSKSNTTYDIKRNGSACQFFIYRKIGNSKINYFVSSLDKADYETCVFNLIDETNSKNAELLEQLQKSEEDKQIAYKEKELCERKLQEYIELKTNWEKELYSNFLLLLNEKKKRISFLTSLLQARKIDEDEVESEGIEIVSDSESNEPNDDYETDEDDEVPEIENPDTQPSTSAINDLLKPDSPPPLLLPKRMKRDNTKLNAGGTLLVGNGAVKNEKMQQKVPEVKVAEENTPTLTFTTQDLLDRM